MPGAFSGTALDSGIDSGYNRVLTKFFVQKGALDQATAAVTCLKAVS